MISGVFWNFRGAVFAMRGKNKGREGVFWHVALKALTSWWYCLKTKRNPCLHFLSKHLAPKYCRTYPYRPSNIFEVIRPSEWAEGDRGGQSRCDHKICGNLERTCESDVYCGQVKLKGLEGNQTGKYIPHSTLWFHLAIFIYASKLKYEHFVIIGNDQKDTS